MSLVLCQHARIRVTSERQGASQMAFTFELCEPTALAEGGKFMYVSITKTRS